mmetsp:Transcript_105069/g.338824  ORF Transcript_105069/g.338824 Transcript_105069/m.338824 type:complete len:174 (+) Transcript_105069:88-609(+)
MEVRYSATPPSMRPQSPSAAPPLPPSALLERRRRALVDRAGKAVRAGAAAAAAEAEVRRLSRSKLLPTILARRAAPLARSAVNKAAVAVSAKLPKTLRVVLPRTSLCLASPLRTNGTRAKLTGLAFFFREQREVREDPGVLDGVGQVPGHHGGRPNLAGASGQLGVLDARGGY